MEELEIKEKVITGNHNKAMPINALGVSSFTALRVYEAKMTGS